MSVVLAEKYLVIPHWQTRVFNDPSRFEKWKKSNKRRRYILDPYVDELFDAEGVNLVLNLGADIMFDLFIGAGGTVFSNANAHIGIGDSNTAAADAQTGLQAATNKFYEPMDATFPSIDLSGRRLNFEATVADGDAEYSWQEFTLENAAAGAGTAFNRLVQNQGTKVAGQVRTITLRLTWP